jgi:ISXO2-like transposase domain
LEDLQAVAGNLAQTGVWSLIKRGIFGNFHHVSKRYLPLYLNEFSFRHNNRKNDDMFSTVVAGS